MFKSLFKRLGIYKATLVITIAAIPTSILITTLLLKMIHASINTSALIIAAIVPSIIAPVFGYLTLRVLFQLYDAEERLHILSITDDLTHAFNRRRILELINSELERTRRYGNIFSIILIDVDGFKNINDAYGHAVGDMVLRELSQICMQNTRKIDTFARYGGEEFIFLLPQTDQNEAIQFAERIRRTLYETRLNYNHTVIQFTISAGVTMVDIENPDLDTLLLHADNALYAAKRRGKNCTVAHSPSERLPARNL